MITLAERLKIGAEILLLIDRKRTETGDANFGAGIERAVLDSHLRELSEAALSEEAPKECVVFKRSRKAA